MLDPATCARRRADKLGQVVPEDSGVVFIEIDLVDHAVKTERDGLDALSCRAIKVINELDDRLLSHGGFVRFAVK